MTPPHGIAAIANREGEDSQELLARAVAGWTAAGARVVGVLAESVHGEGVCSAAFLRDIATGTRFSIQLDTVPAGTACHLDTGGIDEACALLVPRITDADIVVLSKFGKTEAAHGGLWPAFAQAIAAGRPVLTTVSSRHAAAWAAFAPDAARLEPDAAAIERWWRAAASS